MENEVLNIYEKIENIRVALQKANIKKSGTNSFANFSYFTLDDILPKLNELMLEYKLFSNFSLDAETATLTLINAEKIDEQVVFTSPIAEAQIKGSTPIQCLGGVHTYMKRYLYLNAFEIVEGDVLDALAGSDKLEAKGTYKPKKVQVPLAQDLLAEAERLKIDLNKLAAYLKKDASQLTNEDLKKAIDQKTKALKEVK